MSIYLDASVLVSWHLPDVHSPLADALLRQHATPLVSDLGLAETANAIIRRRKQGRVPVPQAARMLAKLDGHVAAGRFQVVELIGKDFSEARRLAEWVSEHLRTADDCTLPLPAAAPRHWQLSICRCAPQRALVGCWRTVHCQSRRQRERCPAHD